MLVFFLIVLVIIQILILDDFKRCLNQLFDSIDLRKSPIDGKESRRSTLEYADNSIDSRRVPHSFNQLYVDPNI